GRTMLEQAERAEQLERAFEVEQEVTALELFFDLVFVFAITQVTRFLSHDPTWTRLVEAMAILMVLWFSWSAYVWLQNRAATDEGAIRFVLLVAMGPVLVASLAVPNAFGKDALLFGVAFFLVRALHIVAYAVVARDDPTLLRVVVRLARTIMPAAALLVVAGFVPGTGRALCWVGALAIDYGGLFLSGTSGWRVAPSHFAERHRLIVIIAIGESIVALSAFKRRNVGSFNYPRLVAAAVLVALAPVATELPALGSLALVTATTCVLIGYEVVRYAEARDRIRHG